MANLPLTAAIKKATRSGKLPTNLSSAEIARIRPAIRERAVFSARVLNAEFLDEISAVTRGVVGGQIDQRKARTVLKRWLKRDQYVPEPGDDGTIKDLSSDARIRLIVRTNVGMARGYGQRVKAVAEIDKKPWQELYRRYPRLVPRDWPTRWLAAGGQMVGGRMVAVVSDPVWERISRFGNPYPPFDFNSGMWVRTRTNQEVGKKARTQLVGPRKKPQSFNKGLESDVVVGDDRIRRQLLRDLGPGYGTKRGAVVRKTQEGD